MKTSRGIVAVVFKRDGNEKKFLILHRILNWTGWETPKGSIEDGENFETAVLRELFEETGIKKISKVKKLRAIMRFFDSVRKVNREMHAFLVEADAGEKVSFSNNAVQEHDSFEWVDFGTALEKLTFEGQKKIFSKALKSLWR